MREGGSESWRMENRTPVFRGQKMVERVGDLGDRILKTEN